jgi:hypothetical protein
MKKGQVLAEICDNCGRERGEHVSNFLLQEELGRKMDHLIDFCPNHKTKTKDFMFKSTGIYRSRFGGLTRNVKNV